jgi:outer membrane protein OmpA-like peptidoglycan-associated protein
LSDANPTVVPSSERGTEISERGTSKSPSQPRRSSSQELDERPTTSWAIGSIGSAGLFVGYSTFMLLNLETGRAHLLHVPTLNFGLIVRYGKHDAPLPSASGGAPSYVAFETPEKMTFGDFGGLRCRITSANMGVFWGYGITYLTLWRTLYRDQVAYVRMSGWGPMLPGGSVAHGVTIFTRGSGSPGEINVPRVLVLIDDDPLPEPLRYIRLAAQESPVVNLPGDPLFDFDSARVRPEAIMQLTYLADLLNNRRTYPVSIEGHTDKIGAADYNRDLSLRRATAIKEWFIAKKVDGAKDFRLRAYGESRPLVPETRRDGSDDPSARARNRRVTVSASWNFIGR